MLAKAHENIKRAGLEDTIAVIAGDASDVLPCLDKSYDMILWTLQRASTSGFCPNV